MLHQFWESMEEIQEQFTGAWVHVQDDLLPNFFEAVGATDKEKHYMISSTPRMSFTTDRDVITSKNTPHPVSNPEETAECDFKLNQEFTFEPKGVLLKITVEWKDGKMIQNITPVNSHILPHVIEHFIDNKGQMIQVYKLTDSSGKEVKGTRTFKREDQ